MHPYIVLLCGASGSGKTTLLHQLAQRLPKGAVCIVSQDDYYHPIHMQGRDANGQVNFDLPEGIDSARLANDLHQLSQGNALEIKEYTFNVEADKAAIKRLESAPIIIVEGLFVLHYEVVRRAAHLKVFVEAPEHALLERRLARDMRERGYTEADIRYQWQHHVLPAYEDFLAPYRPEADLIVNNTTGMGMATDVLCHHLLALLGKAKAI